MDRTSRPAPPPADAPPPQADDGGTRRRLGYGEQAAIGLFVIAAFAVMKLMDSLLVPMLAAIILGSLIARGGDGLAKIGVPPMLAGLGLVVVACIAAFLMIDALIEPLSALIAQVPAMVGKLSATVAPLMEPVNALKDKLAGMMQPAKAGAGAAAPMVVSTGNEAEWLTGLLVGLTPALGEFFIFFTTLAFFVAGRVSLRRAMIRSWGDRAKRLAAIRILNAVDEALVRYFGAAALIYAGVALATGSIAFAAGLTSPVLWGVLTFTASFIPYFGAALITLALAAGGLMVHDGLITALIPAAGFLVIHVVAENLVVPAFLGRRLDLNPFVVFVSILFWSWMWGPFGAVLAVPLLIVADTIRCELKPHGPAQRAALLPD